MSNSSMVDYVRISPNHYNGRAFRITKITPHYCDGNISLETLGDIFAPTARRASSNYGISSDGRVGMYVPEDCAAWTSSNWDNDNRAVTIECANLPDSSLTPAAWASLVALCVDICERNGIPELRWTGGPDGTLTCHDMFADTSCPGAWLRARMPKLAEEVNARLLGTEPTGVADEFHLEVDGWFGPRSIQAMQLWLRQHGHDDVVADGEVWHQYEANRQDACTRGWYWDWSCVGSPCIRALQRELGVTADGLIGPETIRELQRRLGTVVDGRLDGPSPCVRRLQANLNEGRLV